jgi:2-iminobutanoate/2-iminopropanoate deaminase
VREAVGGTQPVGPYSPGIIAEGRFLFVSGQGSLQDGEIISGTIEEETRLTLENLGRILEQAGASFDDVVRVGIFLADLTEFEPMNAVYESFFAVPRPARTTVGAALMGIKVEIDCVARLPRTAD